MAVFVGLVVCKFNLLEGHLLPHPELPSIGIVRVIVLHLVGTVCVSFPHLYPLGVEVLVTVGIHWHHLQ